MGQRQKMIPYNQLWKLRKPVSPTKPNTENSGIARGPVIASSGVIENPEPPKVDTAKVAAFLEKKAGPGVMLGRLTKALKGVPGKSKELAKNTAVYAKENLDPRKYENWVGRRGKGGAMGRTDIISQLAAGTALTEWGSGGALSDAFVNLLGSRVPGHSPAELVRQGQFLNDVASKKLQTRGSVPIFAPFNTQTDDPSGFVLNQYMNLVDPSYLKPTNLTHGFLSGTGGFLIGSPMLARKARKAMHAGGMTGVAKALLWPTTLKVGVGGGLTVGNELISGAAGTAKATREGAEAARDAFLQWNSSKLPVRIAKLVDEFGKMPEKQQAVFEAEAKARAQLAVQQEKLLRETADKVTAGMQQAGEAVGKGIGGSAQQIGNDVGRSIQQVGSDLNSTLKNLGIGALGVGGVYLLVKQLLAYKAAKDKEKTRRMAIERAGSRKGKKVTIDPGDYVIDVRQPDVEAA